MARTDPRTSDPGRPSSARLTNYWLGGTNYTAADQAKAAEIERACPAVRQMALDSRLFTARAAGWAAGEGIRQFIDLGCGLPPPGPLPPVHAVARSVRPGARVCYVDHDPEVTDYLGDVITDGGIAAVTADLRDPAEVWSDPGLLKVIDPGEPACLILTLVLHFVPAWKARAVVQGYMRLAAPGSIVAVSVPRVDDPAMWKQLAAAYPAGVENYSARQAGGVLRGLELVPPGVGGAAGLRPGWADIPCSRKGPAYVLGGIGVRQ